MKEKINKLKTLIKELAINEVFEAMNPVPYVQTSHNSYYFSITINGVKEDIDVVFDNMNTRPELKNTLVKKEYQTSDKTYNLAYSINMNDTQYTRSTGAVLLTILATVFSIVKDFIKQEQPDYIYIHPEEKNDDSKQKRSIYKSYIDHQITTIPSYKTDVYADGYIIYKLL